MNTLKALRSISDPTRLRLLALLKGHELSVAEIQEITKLAQSRISTHLGNLQDAGLVKSQKKGKRSIYSEVPQVEPFLDQILEKVIHNSDEIPEIADDQVNLRRILERQKDLAQAYFHQAAGCFDRIYGPGRSWETFGKALLRMLPKIEVADLGSGEGLLSELLAYRCHRVYAIDNSAEIVDFATQKLKSKGIKNLEFKLGEIEAVPLADGVVDVAILSQSLHHAERPEKAISEAYRILKPGGQILILDLLKHEFKDAKRLYGDNWNGFAEAELHRWLEKNQFHKIDISIVATETDPPQFSTILAEAYK